VTEEPTKESIQAEFPGWYVSRGTDNRWHARLRGTRPPVTVADDHLDGLREEIIRKSPSSTSRPGWLSRTGGSDD
jgi:hypothetical protein